MTASSWLLLNPRHLLTLILVLTLTKLITATRRCPYKYDGVVGGSVTLCCPIDDSKNLNMLYFQRGKDFVNGYYLNKPITTGIWPNTEMDFDNNSVHMSQLNISHNGDYDCHYRENDKRDTLTIHLTVTAPFSKPSITKTCDEKGVPTGCYVTCASHNGYPKQTIQWNVDNQTWKHLNDSEKPCPITQVLNISSTIYINCSSAVVNVSCSVGSVSSNIKSPCAPQVELLSLTVLVATAICLVVVTVVVIIVCIECKKSKKKKRRAAVNEVSNGTPMEVVALNAV